MIPAGVFNQFSEVPLGKQCWISFATPAQAANDAGITLNYSGSSTSYAPSLAADGSGWGYDTFIHRSTGVDYFGVGVPIPRDLNSYGIYLFNPSTSYVRVTVGGDYKFDVYWLINMGASPVTAQLTERPPSTTRTVSDYTSYPVGLDLDYTKFIKSSNEALTAGVDNFIEVYPTDGSEIIVHGIVIIDRN